MSQLRTPESRLCKEIAVVYPILLPVVRSPFGEQIESLFTKMGLPNCHERWCPYEFKVVSFESCKNVAKTLNTLYLSSLDSSMLIACCQLYCGERSQLLLLQCQGISERMAFLTWFIAVILIFCVMAQLVSLFVERGARKVTFLAGPSFLAFIAVIVYVFAEDPSFYGDTPFYPVVGAMSVAAFSYFFSSFQYSIHLAYEIAPATVLLLSMFPMWTNLTVKRGKLISASTLQYGDPEIARILNFVIGMLALSILWVLHSILFRTVGYRADWIRGYNSVHTENPGDNHMCRLWVLGGAQGHPTWRTPAGQCIGIYLAVVSWVIALAIHNFLTEFCIEDWVLFHLMLWVPPASLTLAVIFTQLSMCKFRASCGHQEKDKGLFCQWILHDFLSLIQTYKYMEAAVISYRLGRDSLQPENHIETYRIGWWDWFLAQIVFLIEIVIFCVSYPGIFILRVLQTLGVCVVKLIWKRTLELDMKEKNKAYRTLCERCLSEDIAEAYENSGKEYHVEYLQDGEKDLQVQEIFRNHRMKINLPLLLDNTSPARLSYLLHQLDVVLRENPPRSRVEVLHPYIMSMQERFAVLACFDWLRTGRSRLILLTDITHC